MFQHTDLLGFCNVALSDTSLMFSTMHPVLYCTSIISILRSLYLLSSSIIIIIIIVIHRLIRSISSKLGGRPY